MSGDDNFDGPLVNTFDYIVDLVPFVDYSFKDAVFDSAGATVSFFFNVAGDLVGGRARIGYEMPKTL